MQNHKLPFSFTFVLAVVCLFSLSFNITFASGNNNSGGWSSENRKQKRPAELWKYYMHGVLDYWATPLTIKSIIKANKFAKKYVVYGEPVRNPFKSSSQPAFKVQTRKGFSCRMPISAENIRNRKIRIFFWLKAKKVGDGKGWHAPNIFIIPKNKKGKILYSYNSRFHTQGTYPWHCYYVDCFMPKTTDSLYIKFYTTGGTANFSNFSWEIISDKNKYTRDEKQDPHTGSLAPNVYFDQMAEHMTHGYGRKYKWKWLQGKDAGLIGQPYNITTKKGFTKYYLEKAKHCPEHMNHAILHMGAMYHTGKKLNKLPYMEEQWFKNFAETIINDQDPDTGYWHDGVALSLGLTFHLCDMHFRYYGIKRTDRKDITYPTKALVKYVPRADKIIKQTLKQQSTWTDSRGVKRPAGWNWAAYRYTLTPDKYKEKCHLGSTWDAIYLMRLSERYVDDKKLKAKVYNSVKNALYYIFHKNVLVDGVWVQSDTKKYATRTSYIQNIMRDTHWLERKLSDKIPCPEIKVKKTGTDTVEISGKLTENIDSIRIYAATKSTLIKNIDESNLVGILQRSGKKFYQMDPFIAVDIMRKALARRFGIKLKLPPETHWRGRKYLPWKLRKIKKPLPFSYGGKTLKLNIKDLKDKKLYYSGCSWYGEESFLKEVKIIK